MSKALFNIFKPKPKAVPKREIRTYKMNGYMVSFLNWKSRRLVGYLTGFEIGDRFLVPMNSGRTAIMEITEIKYMSDPKDQFFATVKDIGYTDDL